MAFPSSKPAVPQVVPPAPPDASEPALDIRHYLAILIKRLWIIVTCLMVSVGLVSVWTLRQPKIYKASTSIIIDPRPPRVLQDVSEVVDLGAGSYWATKEFYETEYNVIKSREVSRRVVERLGLDTDPEFLGTAGVEDAELVRQILEHADPVASLQSMISVEPVKDSRMVRVAVYDTNPQRGAGLSTAIAEAYIQQNIDKRVEGTASAVEWLDRQLATLKPKLEASEMGLYEFRKKNDMLSTSLEDRQNIISQKLMDLSSALTSVRTRRIELEAKVYRVEQLRGEGTALDATGLETLSEVTGSDLIERLKNDYFTLLHDHAELEERYLDQHPKLVASKRRLETARAVLRREVTNIVQGIVNEYESLTDAEKRTERALEEVKAEAFEINKKEIEYQRLVRDKENSSRLYDLVLTRAKEADLTAQQTSNNVRLVDAALVPRRPVKPRWDLALVFALMMGLVGGGGLAFLLEHLDNTVKGKEDVENELKLPFMGIIPEAPRAAQQKSKNIDLHILEEPRGFVAEACRSIRANLLFMSPERPLTRLLVTSAGPREGKTTTVVNLGIVMAQSGSRVLLVDTDMRRPRLHKALEVSSARGLSNIILGNATLDEVVQETKVPNLFILPCGPVPPNPAELLHTHRFEAVLEEAAEKYDRLVLDSPPLGVVADAKILSQVADGTIVVARARVTTREMVGRAADALRDVNARILGVLLNQVDLERRTYGGYYYQRYGKYGYYYAGDDEEDAA